MLSVKQGGIDCLIERASPRLLPIGARALSRGQSRLLNWLRRGKKEQRESRGRERVDGDKEILILSNPGIADVPRSQDRIV